MVALNIAVPDGYIGGGRLHEVLMKANMVSGGAIAPARLHRLWSDYSVYSVLLDDPTRWEQVAKQLCGKVVIHFYDAGESGGEAVSDPRHTLIAWRSECP